MRCEAMVQRHEKSQTRSKGNGECYKFYVQDKTESWKDKKNEHIQYRIRLYHGYIKNL